MSHLDPVISFPSLSIIQSGDKTHRSFSGPSVFLSNWTLYIVKILFAQKAKQIILAIISINVTPEVRESPQSVCPACVPGSGLNTQGGDSGQSWMEQKMRLTTV